jgi:SAM-dependent methyltransferase
LKIADDIRSEQQVWSKSDSLEFFQTHRQTPADMYQSERFYLPEILPLVRSVLDIGCAAGGFSRIMKSFNSGIAYTGVDIAPKFVDIASKSFPDSRFILGDGIHFATPPNSYDLVYSTGVFHLNSRWRDMVRAAYEQARRYVLVDFRLTSGPALEGTLRIEFDGRLSDAVLPYYVVNTSELIAFLESMEPQPAAIRARGYYHPPSEMATLAVSQVLMAFFLIEKGQPGNQSTTVQIEFPPEERS